MADKNVNVKPRTDEQVFLEKFSLTGFFVPAYAKFDKNFLTAFTRPRGLST